jgi:hypothetical protein
VKSIAASQGSSGAEGLKIVEKAKAAVSSIKVAQALDAIASMLDATADGKGQPAGDVKPTKSVDTLMNLSAYLTLYRWAGGQSISGHWAVIACVAVPGSKRIVFVMSSSRNVVAMRRLCVFFKSGSCVVYGPHLTNRSVLRHAVPVQGGVTGWLRPVVSGHE